MCAKAVAYPDDEEKLISLISILDEQDVPYILVGGMSNILLKSSIYNGVIIKTDKMASKNEAENIVTLGCGVRTAAAIQSMAQKGFGGMEGLTGIPGTVGGMVKQNAGAFGYEISDRFKHAVCYIPQQRKVVRLSKDEMQFSYRFSMLAENKAVLLSSTFEFIPKEREEILISIRDFRKQRSESQPVEFPSLGSTFKRYNGVSAGFYIDRAGLKGFSIGGAAVSEKHAGFIINTGCATADDYLRLIDYVKNKVYAVFGIELTEEIEII